MYAMLSLDLERNTTSEQRKKFYEYLEKENWNKIPKITTTWYANFSSDVSESDIISITKADVRNAASYAGVTSYEAAVHAGKSIPTTF